MYFAAIVAIHYFNITQSYIQAPPRAITSGISTHTMLHQLYITLTSYKWSNCVMYIVQDMPHQLTKPIWY